MRLRITINGRVYEAEVEVLDDGGPEEGAARARPGRAAVRPAPESPSPAPGPAVSQARGGTEVRASLPGVVSEVRAVAGAEVAVGDVLLVLEAMKMDNDVTAPVAGTLRAVLVAPGDQVAAQQVLAIVDAALG